MYFQFKLRITWELKQNTCEPCNASTIVNVRNRTKPAMDVLNPRHLGNISDGTHIISDFRTAPNYRRHNREKRREKYDVITGSGLNFTLYGSFVNVAPSTGSVLVYLNQGSIRIHVFVTLSDMY